MKQIELKNSQRAALEKAKQDFTAWRENRTGRSRIPDTLWSEAANLFHSFGLSVNRIARGLRLNHATLKAHIEKTPPAVTSELDAAATFVELEPPLVCSDCVIELEKRSREKMRMCFRGRADPAVLDLGRVFLEIHP